jgi:hypothetical protein
VKVRAAVERIDAVGVGESDLAQHAFHALGFGAHLADQLLHVRRQQGGVQRILGEQRADEFLVGLRQAIRLLIRKAGELPAQRFPQQAGAVRLERRHQFRHHLVAEHASVHGDVEKAHVRQQAAKLIAVAAVLRQQDQAADLGQSFIVVPDAQHLMGKVPIQAFAVTFFVDDVKEDVRRAAAAMLSEDH